MFSDQTRQPTLSPSDGKTIIGDETLPTTKDEERRMGHEIAGTGLRSDRSTWWLKFIFSYFVSALAAFLYTRYFGNAQRSCPPCDAQVC